MNTSLDWYIKPVACPESALARIDWLRAHGIATPKAVAIGRSTIALRRIHGQDFRNRLDPKAPLAHWQAMLAPANALNRLQSGSLSWPAWDPSPLIEPRLTGAGSVTAQARAIWQRIAGRLPGGQTLIHGDYHPGQLLGAPNGRLWVIDWDDMAIGHPAVDRLNLLVYLSSIAADERPLWQDQPHLAPKGEDERAIATALLLRRALKLAERDHHAARPPLLIGWADGLSRS